jgi:rhodanese-related sulfurtransferase
MIAIRFIGIIAKAAAVVWLAAVLSQAPALAEEISAPEARQRVEAGTLTIIDVRRPGEWRETGVAEGGLPISLHNLMRLERGEFADDVLKALGGDRSRPVALICAGGVRSSRAEAILREAGFNTVYDINEGMLGNGRDPGWVGRKLPVRDCVRC